MKTQTYVVRYAVSHEFFLNLGTDCCVIVLERHAGYLHWGGMASQAPGARTGTWYDLRVAPS